MLGQVGQFAQSPVVEVPKIEQDNVQIGINVMEETVKLETAIIIRVVIFYFNDPQIDENHVCYKL